jgi:hypothetical protein
VGGIKGHSKSRGLEFFYGKKMKIINWEQDFCTPQNISAVQRVNFVSKRVSFIVLRGRWCNIIVLNVHAPNEEKNDDSKDSLYEEFEQVFGHFPKYHVKILLEDFNEKLGRDDILRPTIGNGNPHQDNNHNGVRIVNLCT